MKFKKYLAILPLAFASLVATAESNAPATKSNGSTFSFATEINRTVDNDLMQAVVFSRKTGKSLPELRQAVSSSLNKVLEEAKKQPSIEIQADGVTNYANYNAKNKVEGWVAEGRIFLKGKDFEAIAKVLENLGENVAISDISFSVSPEKMAALEDEMTLEAIKQFQRKAEVIRKGLNAKGYRLGNVNLETPNGEQNFARPIAYMAKSEMAEDSAMPMESGKATISARASGTIEIEQ
ncbi:hypothetical protein B0187_00580 [Haemophilus paracuniculus]|uniref:SIMPL domain-containing protein n=1 Tax=Haemophilus paracuniculus TaxID=734 RepID=A0A1T0AW20_9PAST|nr:SIMPL domain-containing protein [Haemophilus paracuniculus]OOS00826.1 hypothetical protein B0187_00580 [Haemophilus paracuniculus]